MMTRRPSGHRASSRGRHRPGGRPPGRPPRAPPAGVWTSPRWSSMADPAPV